MFVLWWINGSVMSAKLISIIGPPASGKTALAHTLCDALAGTIIQEDFAGNPFLADSYTGDGAARLPGQIYFLMSRVRQLSRLSWPSSGLCVSDYGFCQDRIFAQLKLSSAELAVYEPLRAHLEALVHPPDLMIHLEAPPAVLIARIESRGRSFERVMDSEFLTSISAHCCRAAGEAACKVISVDTNRVDLRRHEGRNLLLAEVKNTLVEMTI